MDQIRLMVRFLGKLSEDDLSFLSEDSIIQYVKKLDKGGVGVDLQEEFPETSQPLIDLLQKMI